MIIESREAYDRRDALNFSLLKQIGRSPLHYAHARQYGSKDSDTLKLGRVRHLAVLEPSLFASEVVIWRGGKRQSKAWDAFDLANAGKEIINEKEEAEIMALAESVHSHPIAGPLLTAGQAEVTIEWEGDVRCKARLDFVTADAIVELKSCVSASPEAFTVAAYKYKYFEQIAWQIDGFLFAENRQMKHYVVAVENAAPYAVQVYTLTPELIGDCEPDSITDVDARAALDKGRRTYESWLKKLAEATKAKRFSSYSESILPLSLPRWAAMEDE